jgi:hypothetical protein
MERKRKIKNRERRDSILLGVMECLNNDSICRLVCGDQETRAQLQVNGTHRRNLKICGNNVI